MKVRVAPHAPTALVSALLLTLLPGCYGDATLSVSSPPPGKTTAALCAAPLNPPPRLLTREEYDRTVFELLGDDSAPAREFPPENEVLGFRNNAQSHQVHATLLTAYLESAEALASAALAERRGRVLPCAKQTADCAEAFIDTFAPRAWRRPLEPDERAALLSYFHETWAADGFDTAVEWTLQVMLQSPQFLYRLESTRGAPDESGRLALTPEALASRLSYFLWGSMPDDRLFAAARAGALASPEGIEREVRRMLEDPRAHAQVASFHEQWLHLSALATVEKNLDGVPPRLGDSWSGSISRYLEDVFWNGGDLEALLTTPRLYVDSATAPLYGGAAIEGEFTPVESNPEERAGLLTQPALLAMLASPDQSSPVRRGVFVREKLLCQPLSPPPANVDITAPESDPSMTTRERFAEHTSRAECAGCHVLIDPVGFGFENYDAIGRWRTAENGLPVDASGELTGTSDAASEGPFYGAVELSRRLAASAEVSDCVAAQWFRFALGRIETDADACHLRAIQERFAESDGRFEDLLIAIATSDAFRFRSPQDPSLGGTP